MVTRILASVVALCIAAGPARGEPCREQVGLVAGDEAPRAGVLVPPDIPDACSSATASLMSCRRRIAGEREAHAITLRARDERITIVEHSRQAERDACRDQVAPPPATNWPAVGWGIGGGVVVGALAVVAVVFAVR